MDDFDRMVRAATSALLEEIYRQIAVVCFPLKGEANVSIAHSGGVWTISRDGKRYARVVQRVDGYTLTVRTHYEPGGGYVDGPAPGKSGPGQ